MMYTTWGEKLNCDEILPEYPRPQFVRNSYVNLNGPWDYAIRDTVVDELPPSDFDGTILVPFSPEAALSGVNRTLENFQTLWYRRLFNADDALSTCNSCRVKHLILHFGAVDQSCRVYINGQLCGFHEGGYNAFSFDITEFLKSGNNELVVQVHDWTEKNEWERGKQRTDRGGIWYTRQSGIWQTVWMEAVPDHWITDFSIIPDVPGRRFLFEVKTSENDGFQSADITLLWQGAVLGSCRTDSNGIGGISVPEGFLHLWSPESPSLYDITITFGDDYAKSYGALRSISMITDENGIPRLFLNGEPYFQTGVLDQGYWPDGLYTAPSDEALIYDIQLMKSMGFNMLRKHIKVEPMRWYYHCDRLGMLVWQDMPSGGGSYSILTITAPLFLHNSARDSRYRKFARKSEEARILFLKHVVEMQNQLKNCPCIVLWVPFNEGWGQFDAAAVTEQMRCIDTTRLIDHASGWHDQKVSDVKSLHVYFYPFRYKKDRHGRAVVLSEFGGYQLPVAGHTWNDRKFGYKGYTSSESLSAGIEKLYKDQIIPAKSKGLSAAVYTQVSDVEDEVNGFVTYDRKVVKVIPEVMVRINRQLRDL